MGLVTDAQVRAYEKDIMGWDSNPLEDVDPKTVNPDSCPKSRV
jgi:hypothetical protein